MKDDENYDHHRCMIMNRLRVDGHFDMKTSVLKRWRNMAWCDDEHSSFWMVCTLQSTILSVEREHGMRQSVI